MISAAGFWSLFWYKEASLKLLFAGETVRIERVICAAVVGVGLGVSSLCGVGQSAALYKLAPRLLDGAAKLLAACPCQAGCPSCVGPIGEVGERGKEVAGRILKDLL